MAIYSKLKCGKFFLAILFLLFIMAAVVLFSGCGSEKYKISGRVTSGGSAFPGVTVTLSGVGSVMTDANGDYSFSNVSSGTFTLTPSFTGYTFIPPKPNVYLYGRDGIGFDFSGILEGRVVATMHTVALKSDDTVWTWGSNSNGQLGDGKTTDESTPVQVSGLSGIIAIAAGYSHTVALKSDGTVWTWGSNGNGQLGDGKTTDKSTPGQVSGLSSVIAIAAGYAHTVALRNDFTDVTVWTWGSNSNGQLGDGKTTDKHTPGQVSKLSGLTAIAAGYTHTVALKSDGTVWTWGSNGNGQLGDGSTTDRWTPVQIQSL
jgi:hypothetical protein